jgi:hypothetical protein
MAESQDDGGVSAITTLLDTLRPLKPETRWNVLDYVFKTLGITPPAAIAPQNPVAREFPAAPIPPVTPHPASAAMDLRSLTEQKKPKTANQMVAIMAYYLSNLAPQGERRDHIVADDIKRYFPQGNFELPTGRHGMTLVNAKNAGYLDALADGQYRLNPVGHNLVTHKLPRAEGGGSARRSVKPRRAKKKKTNK